MPFSCGYAFGTPYFEDFQQVYGASAFPGPITITGLEFFNTQVDTHQTAFGSGSWGISLSTTSASWNTLSTDFLANLGADNTTVFSGDLAQPWAFGDTLHINLTTPFTYNPANGNLLMTVGGFAPNQAILFDINGYGVPIGTNMDLGNAYFDPGEVGFVVNPGWGLVTGFTYEPATVPEPSSILLLGSGLVGLLGAARRRRDR